MSKHPQLLIKEYDGNYDEIISIVQNTDKKVDKDAGFYIVNSSYSALKIIDDVKTNKEYMRLFIDKNCTEVLPGNIVMYQDSVNELNLKKNLVINKAHEYLSNCVSSVDLIKIISYLESKIYLASKGYYIKDFDDNGKYLEILKESDNEVAKILEDFIDSKSQVEEYMFIYRKYNQLENLMKMVSTDEEADKLLESFMDNKIANIDESIVFEDE